MHSYSEQDLYDMLYEILKDYAIQRSSFDATNVSPKYIILRVKKNIAKCTAEQRMEILGKIITLTNDRILAGVGTKTVFNSLDGISCDLVKSIRRKRVKTISNNNKNQESEEKQELEKNKIIGDIRLYSKRFDIADRDMLISLESDANKKIIAATNAFFIPFGNASIDVISRLNMGMYGKNQSQLSAELNERGIKVSKSSRFIPRMNDHLLKYRLIALVLVLNECRNSIHVIKPKYREGTYNKYEYYKLLGKVVLIGKTISEEFKKEYGKLPKESLINDPYDKKYAKLLENPQMILDELVDDDSAKPIKDSRCVK